MKKHVLKANQRKIFALTGVVSISLSVFISFFHIPTGIFFFAAGAIMLISAIGEE